MMQPNLSEFMDRVGATATNVASRTGLAVSTITRIRNGETDPDGRTMLKISKWADEVGDVLGLEASERLSWDYLLEKPSERKVSAKSAA